MKALLFTLSAFLLVSLNAQEINRFEVEIPMVETDSTLDSTLSLEEDTSIQTQGLIEKKDDRLDLLIEDYMENKKINGYRIQIFSSSNNKWEAVKARSEFLKKYPEEKSYLVYQAPNFKVRIGDYSTRLMAYEHLELIKIDFPSSFIVKDEIEPEFKK